MTDAKIPRSALDAIAAPLRREAAAEGERVVSVAEILAHSPEDDPDADLDAYIV
jgi:hypothetical protein